MIGAAVLETTSEGLSLSANEEWLLAICRDGDQDETEKHLSSFDSVRLEKGNFFQAMGFSLATHTAVLVLAVLFPLRAVPSVPREVPCIRVHLWGTADGGSGSQWAGSASPSQSERDRPGDGIPTSASPSPPPCTLDHGETNRAESDSPDSTRSVNPKQEDAPTRPAHKSKTERGKRKIASKKPSEPIQSMAGTSVPPSSRIPSPSSGTASSSEADGTGIGSAQVTGTNTDDLSHRGLPGRGGKGFGGFDLKDVDRAPSVIRKVEPDFPPAARRMGISGSVSVKFLVMADGSVAKASIIRAEPQGVFDRSALEAVSKWCFKPGYRRGEPVPTWVILSIQFRLSR